MSTVLSQRHGSRCVAQVHTVPIIHVYIRRFIYVCTVIECTVMSCDVMCCGVMCCGVM